MSKWERTSPMCAELSSYVMLFICGRGEGTFWNICIRSSVALQPSVHICQGWLPWSLCSANCPSSSLAEHSGHNVNSWQPNKWRNISIASWSPHSAQDKGPFRRIACEEGAYIGQLRRVCCKTGKYLQVPLEILLATPGRCPFLSQALAFVF